MPTGRLHTVQQVARASGVTVRTLHHYEDIGLLRPSARSEAGYRLYGEPELLRLQQILLGKELGLTLEQIGRLLDDPTNEPRKLLAEQRAELVRRRERIDRMLISIDAAIARHEPGQTTMNTEQLFDGFDAQAHEAEAQRRWGNADPWRTSVECTSGYTKARWREILQESAGLYDEAHALQAAGHAPESPAARDLAERHRQHVERWFYRCDHSMHRGLADLYESDERFAANIDRHGDGLTLWLTAAMRANADAADDDSKR
jgi:MerR family transcriptional regulator, thiopeptide resistance regulator